MGSYCTCGEDADKCEVKTSFTEVQSGREPQGKRGEQAHKKQLNDLSATELAKIQRIQALIRSWLQRRKYQIRKSAYLSSAVYFKEDAKETATNSKVATTVEQRSYTFKSTGAIYTGDWLGGIRNGRGLI